MSGFHLFPIHSFYPFPSVHFIISSLSAPSFYSLAQHNWCVHTVASSLITRRERRSSMSRNSRSRAIAVWCHYNKSSFTRPVTGNSTFKADIHDHFSSWSPITKAYRLWTEFKVKQASKYTFVKKDIWIAQRNKRLDNCSVEIEELRNLLRGISRIHSSFASGEDAFCA